MDLTTAILALATVTGLYMAWNIGANDVANAMGTSVGSGALTLRGAIIVAAIFEFGGAMLVGGSVTQTISKGIVDIEAFAGDPTVLAAGMTCCLFAAALWLNVATYFGWPVSTTHSIVGAVIGFGMVSGGAAAVDWSIVARIALSWVISPLMGGVVGFISFLFVKRLVLNAEHPLEAMGRWGPVLAFPVFAILTLALLYKGLKPLQLDFAFEEALGLSAAVGASASLVLWPTMRRFTRKREHSTREALARVERAFLVLQVMTACFVAFAHGSNDVANAVGPMAAVYGAFESGVRSEVQVNLDVLLIGAVGIVVGLATYGYKVMGTIGTKITELTPSRGFAAEFAAAATIVLASKLGLPVSTTHTLVGAVIGVGFARSIGAINVHVLKGIVASWFVTVPFTAALAAALFALLRLAL